MKRINDFIIIIVLLMFNNPSYSQTVVEPYEIGTWQGFRRAAISYTFDDGSSNQFAIAVPIFDEFNFNLTLFTVTNANWSWPPDWTALQRSASQGHEIGSHTVTHTSLSGMNDTLQTAELKDSQDDIEAHIIGQKSITFAYPYCEAGNKSICSQFYIAARGCSGLIEPSTPRDFMNISSIICGGLGSVKTTQDFINRFGSAANSKGWCVFLLHGIDNDGGWSLLPSTTLRESLEYLNGNQGEFWVSTFAMLFSISENEMRFQSQSPQLKTA